MKFNLRPAHGFTFRKLFTICSQYCLFRQRWFSHPCQELQVEKLYQGVRLISTSSIIALWVLPASIDARHFTNTFLNLDSGNSQQFVRLSAWFAEHHSTHKFSKRYLQSRQDRDLCRWMQGDHKLTYREPQRGQHKDGSWNIWQASSRAKVTRDFGKLSKWS